MGDYNINFPNILQMHLVNPILILPIVCIGGEVGGGNATGNQPVPWLKLEGQNTWKFTRSFSSVTQVIEIVRRAEKQNGVTATGLSIKSQNLLNLSL